MNYNSDLNMFISACCARCIKAECLGALNDKHRESCIKYINWKKLSAADKSKLFLASTVDEINLMEGLIL